MMKLYLIKRKDVCGYDEYDEFLVRAEDEDEALEVLTTYNSAYYLKKENLTFEIIESFGEKKIIIESFNAG
jgi:hypothetical protein